MANLTTAISKDLIGSILPAYGSPRTNLPIWDESQKMFICDQYNSDAGNLYYRGVRFCDHIVIVEKVGLSHSASYIDAIEIYAFNGSNLELVQRRDYSKMFRDEKFIRSESETMLCNYLRGVCKMQNNILPLSVLEDKAKTLIENCYKSYLDSDFNARLTQIIPQIEKK